MTSPSSRPKLLFYVPGLVDGGAERLWACLASAFHARGYPVIFVQDFEAADNSHNLAAAIPVHTLGTGHVRGIRRLAALLKAEQPAVALAAVAGSNLKLMLAIALARVKTAPVLTCHGFNEWQTGVLSLATFLALPVLSRNSARVVAVSDGLRHALVSRWGASPAKTIALANPVFFPPAAPVPSRDEIAARPPVILAAGRLTAGKDFATLIRAMALLKCRDANLVILGKGPARAALEGEISRLGLKGRVELAGYAAHPWRHFETARVFACSSRSESFGNAIVEAMAHGLSVVATACDGPREILVDGRFGRIVPIGDTARLAHALDAALSAPDDPVFLRQRAEAFSFAARVPIYEDLIAEVVKEHSLDTTAHNHALPRVRPGMAQ